MVRPFLHAYGPIAALLVLFSWLAPAFADMPYIDPATFLYELPWPMDRNRTVVAEQGVKYSVVGLIFSHYSDDSVYYVFRSDTEGVLGTLVSTANAAAFGWWQTDVTVTDDTNNQPDNPYWSSLERLYQHDYWYTVVFEDSNGNRSFSYPQALGWEKPVDYINDLSATKGTSTQSITLTWTPIPDAVSYTVLRGFDGTIVGTTTNPYFSDTSVMELPVVDFDMQRINGPARYDQFMYQVQANFLYKSSTTSNTVWGYLQPLVDPVSDLQASAEIGAVSLSWTANPNATSYDLYKSQYCDPFGSECQWALLTSLPGGATSFVDTMLYAGDPNYPSFPYYSNLSSG